MSALSRRLSPALVSSRFLAACSGRCFSTSSTPEAGKLFEEFRRRFDPREDHFSAKMNDMISNSRKRIAFTGDVSVGDAGSIFVVGQLGALKAFLPKAPEEVKVHLANFLAAHENDGENAPSTTVSLAPYDGGMRRIVVLKVADECSRFNTRARPDQVTKLLAGQSGFGGAKRDVKVYVVGESKEDAAVGGLAAARALPGYREKRKMDGDGKVSVTLWSNDGEMGCLGKLGKVAESVRMAAALVDMPPNYVNPVTYRELCEELAGELRGEGYDIKIASIEGMSLKERGFGGLWNVGKGSVSTPPALVCLSWYPEGSGKYDRGTVLVGKGITFDSGGLSIKSSDNMRGMKTDMGGAAGLLGAFLATVRCGGNGGKPLHLVQCLAENAVGPYSYRVDDVIKMYSGLTVEINNTDAEGRLLLADGVAYAAKHLRPEMVIDMATLTGAAGMATGHMHAAIVSSDEELEKQAIESGKRTGDLVHPLVFCPEFHKGQFKSEVADLTNSVKVRTDAPVSSAGWFVYENLRAACEGVGDVPPYLHIDMAFPVNWLDGDRASGYGVALVADLLGAFNSN
ncbi:putative aminopeptidase npepl1 [Perkinsus chesapeaki]|uniref:Putative aminopeptidase npepl1 n=1 Tax=Perkinsus chesapeaki TaxID=330153 RepID=A0A7J6MUU5_PERCH|nr:putative aminopeptidase npepl1 [Perkinsus chesapeaki]